MAKDEGIKTNGFNKQKTTAFLKDLDRIEKEEGEAHAKISEKYAGQRETVKEAAEAIGINRRVLGKVSQERKLLRKIDSLRGNLGDEDLIDQFDNVKLAGGMTLFDAAGVDAPPQKKPAPSGKKPPSKGGKPEVTKDVKIQDGEKTATSEGPATPQ